MSEPAEPHPAEPHPALYPAVLACFLLSGFAALLYETAWLRQFSFVFGTSAPATATVLAAYMGGLALGAAIAGRYAARVRRPVLAYGVLELGIALSALAVPFAVDAARGLLVVLAGGRPGPPDAGGPAVELFHLACGFVILAIPTACMGATLPLLARYAVRRRDQIGGRVGVLYATNTGGAVLGTIVAGFALLPALGLWGTILVGAAINAIVFVVACVIARAAPGLDEPGDAVVRTPALDAARGEEWPRAVLVLPIMLLSGAAAFAYEVLWTRLLGHVLGGSVVAFSTMLSSFLLGIALGSAIAARFARERRTAAVVLVIAQVGTAFVSVAVYQALDTLPRLADSIGAGAHATLAANALVAAAVLLPATICIGATFPCAVRILARDERDAARAAARVLSWNTIGAIVGAVAAGFVLVPTWGFDGTLRVAVLLNAFLAGGVVLLFPRPSLRRAGVAAVVAAAVVAILLVLPPRPPADLLRYSPLTGLDSDGAIVHTGVGRSATVTVIEGDGVFTIRTDGMPEARIAMRGAPPGWEWARWLTALPALARPDAESLLVIGFGGGVSVSGVPPDISSIDVIEIEPEVIEANRVIAGPRLHDPLADERLTVVINDARGALTLTDRRYDLIVSQPSHPWTAGASHLYTREFLDETRAHLARGGVFVQWMNSRFVDAGLFRTLGATLIDAFANVRLYNPYPDMLIFLASDAEIDPARAFARDGSAPALSAAARSHYARLGIRSVEDLAATLLLDDAGLRVVVDGAPLNTDDRNRLSFDARRAVRRALGADGAPRLAGPHDALLRDATPAPADAAGVVSLPAVVRRLRATDMLERAAMVEATRGATADRALETPAIAEARRHAEEGEWSAVRVLDERLAATSPAAAWFQESVRLRALWRLRVTGSDEASAAEAITLIDDALAPEWRTDLLLVRLEAARRADRVHEVLETAAVIARIGDHDARMIALAAVRSLEGDPRPRVGRLVQVAQALARRAEP